MFNRDSPKLLFFNQSIYIFIPKINIFKFSSIKIPESLIEFEKPVIII